MKVFGLGLPELIILGVPCLILLVLIVALIIILVLVSDKSSRTNPPIPYNPNIPLSYPPMQPLAGKPDQAAELAKWKQLLDTNAITLEEYDAKKKEILG
jgi:hypothetical protein